MPDDDALNLTFAALANPTRRAIVSRLSEGDATVNELASPFTLTLPAVSKHLKVLEAAGLVERNRQSRFRLCRLDAGPLLLVVAWTESVRARSLDGGRRP